MRRRKIVLKFVDLFVPISHLSCISKPINDLPDCERKGIMFLLRAFP
jgi:hypothetical protein